MSEYSKFEISFRRMEDVPNICDYCEMKQIAWYNELLCLGYCAECMRDMIAEYEKNGGD